MPHPVVGRVSSSRVTSLWFQVAVEFLEISRRWISLPKSRLKTQFC